MYQRLIDQVLFGAVITVDYGFAGPEGLLRRGAPVVRAFGSRVFYSTPHNLFWNPGKMDITSDIDFDILRRIGLSQGARELYFGYQPELLGNMEGVDRYLALIHGIGLGDLALN